MTCFLFLRTSSYVNFFLSKVRDFWSSLESAGSDQEPEHPLMSCTFSMFFLAVTTAEVASLILHCHQKSCPLHPIPTYLLKNLVDVLVAPITKIIVNLFLPSRQRDVWDRLKYKKSKSDPFQNKKRWRVHSLKLCFVALVASQLWFSFSLFLFPSRCCTAQLKCWSKV